MKRIFAWRRSVARYTYCLIAALASLSALPAHAQMLLVPAGGTTTVSGGTLDLNCNDLVIRGNLVLAGGSIVGARDVFIDGGSIDAGGNSISFSRDWSNTGSFTPSSGTVRLVDGCGSTTARLLGSTTFNNFEASSSTGKQLQLEAGATQSFLGSVSISGVSGQRLLVRSTQPGNPAQVRLLAGASTTVSWIDVADINASSGAMVSAMAAAASNSIDSGNNTNVFAAASVAATPVPVNTLPLPALLFLILSMITLSMRFRGKLKPKAESR